MGRETSEEHFLISMTLLLQQYVCIIDAYDLLKVNLRGYVARVFAILYV